MQHVSGTGREECAGRHARRLVAGKDDPGIQIQICRRRAASVNPPMGVSDEA